MGPCPVSCAPRVPRTPPAPSARPRSGVATPALRSLRGVAAATLRALDHLVGEDIRPHVDVVSLTPAGMTRVAIAQVIWVSQNGTERLTGSVAVGDDARCAMVRATVDAVNRRLDRPFLFP